jgi:curved DNA-binding protein CbpA
MSEAIKANSLNRLPREPFSDQVSTYYLELERLLDRVESSTDHYQALGVDRACNSEGIQRAYRRAVTLLHPSQCGLNIVLPGDIEEKARRSYEKLAQAFAVLGKFGKRVEYDNSLRRKTTVPLPVIESEAHPKPDQTAEEQTQQVVQEAAPEPSEEKVKFPSVAIDSIEIKNVAGQSPVAYIETSGDEAHHDHRRSPRFHLRIPVRVAGYDKQGNKWQDMAQTIDVSRFGVAMEIHKRVRRGMILHLTLPLPTKLRAHGYSDPSYSVWTIVRRVEPVKDGVREVGVEFLGEHPPAGFLSRPGEIYRSKKWDGSERRREVRKQLAEQVRLEFLDEADGRIAEESATLENISPSGARVRLKSVPAEFNLVRVVGKGGDFNSLAIVRDWFSGKDGFERLCLNFIDHKWPL